MLSRHIGQCSLRGAREIEVAQHVHETAVTLPTPKDERVNAGLVGGVGSNVRSGKDGQRTFKTCHLKNFLCEVQACFIPR